MKFVILNVPGHGYVNPTLVVMAELARQVGFFSSPILKEVGRGLTQINADFDLLSANSAFIRVPMDDY